MIIDWAKLSYSECIEILKSAPKIAKEWTGSENAFVGPGETFFEREDALAPGHYLTEISKNYHPEYWYWWAAGKTGSTQTWQEAQEQADKVLIEAGVRLPK